MQEKDDGAQNEERKENKNLGSKSAKKAMKQDKDDDKDEPTGNEAKPGSEPDAAVNDDTESYELIGHTGPVFSVAISVCDRHLLSGSYDNTIRRWSLQTKGPLMVYYGHSFPVWEVKFSPLGSYFASCSADRTAKLWILKRH